MVTYKKSFIYIVLLIVIVACNNSNIRKNVYTGDDILLSDSLELIENKNLAIVTNHSALLNSGTHFVDSLNSLENIKIVKLFGPEHGIRGNAPDGITINDSLDEQTGIPIISLYGKIKKPTYEMLANVDLLIYDIQDIGARFYTYISTLYYLIESAAEFNIPIIVLDRPNLLNGIDIDGPLLNRNFISFVGIEELPIRHGMTIGELALFFNHQIKKYKNLYADLKIIKMKNWERKFYFDDCNLKWINPSPNIPNFETALVYPGLCLLEGTNISEGRGTLSPFLTLGSPYLNTERLIVELSKLDLEGIEFSRTSFTPKEIKKMSKYPKYQNEKCKGISLKITDKKKFNSIHFAINLIYLFHKLHPQKFNFRSNWIDKLWGSSFLREAILTGETPHTIENSYKTDLYKFKEFRKQFLLY